MVALATGLPSADFNSTFMACPAGAAELVVGDVVDVVVCSLFVRLESQAANTATGAVRSATAAVARFNIASGYPKHQR